MEREVRIPIADEVVALVYGLLEPGDVVELPPISGELPALELGRRELYVELAETEAEADEDPDPVVRLTNVPGE